jgi:hypothetical protein
VGFEGLIRKLLEHDLAELGLRLEGCAQVVARS